MTDAIWLSLKRLVLGAVAAVALAACGGGGGGTAGGPTEPDPPNQGAFTTEQRNRATARIAEKYDQLVASNAPDRWQALRNYALSLPEFSEAGYADDTLWARFTDGRYFVYVDNWKQVDQAALARSAAPVAGADSPDRFRAGAAAAPRELPRSASAMLLELAGPEFTEVIDGTRYASADTIQRAKRALTDQGWNVSGNHQLSVQALRSNVEHGILYLTSHGGAFGPDDAKDFALITTTPSTDENEARFAADVEDNSLVYTRSRFKFWIGASDNAPHYAITSKFVRKHLRFSPNSLVVLMLCNGGSDGAANFRAALTAKNAGTIVAWNGYANVLGYEVVDLLFDRMTAANTFDVATPPNRAFHFDDVWSYLEKKGKLINPPSEVGGQPAFIKRFGAGFDLTNPVIAQMQLQVGDKLYLHGEFGTEPGTVTVGGATLPSTWLANGKIVLVQLTPESNGDVVLTARGRKSNVRTLVSWKGKVTYEFQDLPSSDASAAGVLSNKVEVDLHLRSDGHAVRTAVDGALMNNTWNIVPASNTTARWSATGTRTVGGRRWESWSGSGNFDVAYPFLGQPDEMGLLARIKPLQGNFELTPLFTQHPKVLVTKYNGNPPVVQPLRFDFRHYGFFRSMNVGFFDHEPLAFGTYIPFDANLNVPAAQYVGNISSTERMVVTWGGMVPTPSFQPQVGR